MFSRNTKISLLKGLITKRTPIYVQYAVTKNCNFKCRMCDSFLSRQDEKELSLSQIERLSDVLNRIGAGIILLTGGEPFLRRDLSEIIDIFTRKGFTVRLQTNGVLATEDMIKLACDAGMREVTISLDSLEPAKQDTITGIEGSWHRIIKAISCFSRMLPLKKSILGVNIVVCRQNLEEIPNLIRFVTEIGFYASLIPIHVATTAESDFIIRKDAPEFAFRQADFELIDKAYKKIIDMKRMGYHIYNSYKFLRNSPVFLKGERVLWRCDSPYLYFAISPAGNFLPCVDIKTSESMLDDSFVNLYNSREFRRKMDDMVKKCPGCFYACWPEMTFLCRDPLVFAERIHFSATAYLKKRRPVTYEKCLSIIEEIKNTN